MEEASENVPPAVNNGEGAAHVCSDEIKGPALPSPASEREEKLNERVAHIDRLISLLQAANGPPSQLPPLGKCRSALHARSAWPPSQGGDRALHACCRARPLPRL